MNVNSFSVVWAVYTIYWWWWWSVGKEDTNNFKTQSRIKINKLFVMVLAVVYINQMISRTLYERGGHALYQHLPKCGLMFTEQNSIHIFCGFGIFGAQIIKVHTPCPHPIQPSKNNWPTSYFWKSCHIFREMNLWNWSWILSLPQKMIIFENKKIK